MTFEPLTARPLLGFEIVQNPDQPTVPILVLKTVDGATAFLVTREVLEGLGSEFQKAASKVPRKQDQN